MPRRIASAYRDIGALSRRDPSSFVMAFAIWSLLNGVSLIFTQDTFHKTPLYAVVVGLGLDDNLIGMTMLLDSGLLAYSIIARDAAVRAAIAYLSGIAWFAWGCFLGLGAWSVHLISASAIWVVVCSFWLMRSITAHPPGAPNPRDTLAPAPVEPDHFPPIHIPDHWGT